MKYKTCTGWIAVLILISATSLSCKKQKSNQSMPSSASILFLHHSTGKVILRAGSSRISAKLGIPAGLPKLISRYNRQNGTSYVFHEQYFPKEQPYGWKNYPYDYYNIWVKHAGDVPFQDEPTLEMLVRKYNVIVFKHCFPVSRIAESNGQPDIDSEEKTLENYKLQYAALKAKLREFPQTRFILWTGAANVEPRTTPDEARRAGEFFDWVVREWDEPGDNIFLWDFWKLETEGGPYLPAKNAEAPDNSHPGDAFAARVAPLFLRRLVDVIENRGDNGSLTGE